MSKQLTFHVLRDAAYLGLMAQDSKNVASPGKPAGREFPQRGEVVSFSARVWLSRRVGTDQAEDEHGKRIGLSYHPPDGTPGPNAFHVNFFQNEGHLFIEMLEFLTKYWDRTIHFAGANLKDGAWNENQDVVLSAVDDSGHTIECRRGLITVR